MGKYASVVIGAAVGLLGLLGLKSWWGEFIMIIKGSLPIVLIFAGVIAVIAGISELRDEQRAKEKADKADK